MVVGRRYLIRQTSGDLVELSHRDFDRADDQALTRPSRPREAVQPRRKLDARVGDHSEVRNVQFAEQQPLEVILVHFASRRC